jgi:F0F1-type ATP synthase membrane subunit b/b'
MQTTIEKALKLFDLTLTDGAMILVGTALLLVLYKSLEALVFKPTLEHVEHRESATVGALFTADQMRQKTNALRARHADALFQARVEANRARAEMVGEAKTQASAILAKAESEAAAELAAGRKDIDEQLKRAEVGAEKAAQELAAQLATQVDSQLTVH